MVMLGTKWPSMTSVGGPVPVSEGGRLQRMEGEDSPMWTHCAPQCIMRLISFPRSAKLLARTDGETIASGAVIVSKVLL